MPFQQNKSQGKRDYFICPHCGAEVDKGAISCRECGSDARTGWHKYADKLGAEIPTGYGKEDDFDYDEFVRSEFPEQSRTSGRRAFKKWLLIILVALLCLSLLLFWF